MNYSKKYSDAVKNGDIIAGRKIKLATKRTLKDLKSQKKETFPYYFNEELATKAINFVEVLPARDGSDLQLELFQKYMISELFGWRLKDDDTRRFDRAFISMARKSGKSFLMSSIGAIYLLLENKPAKNREIIFTANSLKQAHLAFDMLGSGLRQLAKKSPSLRQRLKINRLEILDLDSDSKAIPLATDLKNLDGYQSDLAIIDEFATAKSKQIYEVLKSGQVNSDNSLLAVISTSGNDLNSPMYQEYQFVEKVLKGDEQADRYFIAIWEQDFKTETYKSETWEKSNPLLANEQRAKIIIPKLTEDVALATKQGDLLPVRIKNFNQWLMARTNSYISAKDWKQATVSPPDVTGRDVYIGIDLSKANDLTSISWIVPMKDYLYCDSHSFVATKWGLDDKIKKDGFNYRQGEQDGECSITKLESGVIDYNEVLQYILSLIHKNKFNVLGICYDAWSFGYLLAEFDKQNLPLIEVRQGTQTLSIPTIKFRDNLFNGNIKHADNKLLAYTVNNAILKYDSNNNPIIDKSTNSNKIDALAGLMNAYTQAVDYFESADTEQANNEYYTSDQFSF